MSIVVNGDDFVFEGEDQLMKAIVEALTSFWIVEASAEWCRL